MLRLMFALLLASTVPLAAGAKDTFKNLPGVRDPAEAKRKVVDPECVSGIVVPWPGDFPHSSGLGYRAYGCEYGNVAVGSNSPPNMIEYRKLKERY